MVIMGEKIKVFIEKSDGTLYDLDGMITNINMQYSNREYVEFSINGVSTGAVMSHEDVAKKRTAKERQRNGNVHIVDALINAKVRPAKVVVA